MLCKILQNLIWNFLQNKFHSWLLNIMAMLIEQVQQFIMVTFNDKFSLNMFLWCMCVCVSLDNFLSSK
jgi:hypothetical protein